MTAATLGLSVLPEFGEAYLIPYNKKKKVGNAWQQVPELQVQLGYKGLIKLAQNSGRVAKVRAVEMYAGDNPVFDRVTGEISYTRGYDPDVDDNPEIVGYLAMYTDMQTKEVVQEYWTKARIIKHAIQFSQSYNGPIPEDTPQKDLWKFKGPWYEQFDAMAKKTVIKALLKFAPKSTDDKFAQAIELDTRAENETRKDITPAGSTTELNSGVAERLETIEPVNAPEQAQNAQKANEGQLFDVSDDDPFIAQAVEVPNATKNAADAFFEEI